MVPKALSELLFKFVLFLLGGILFGLLSSSQESTPVVFVLLLELLPQVGCTVVHDVLEPTDSGLLTGSLVGRAPTRF